MGNRPVSVPPRDKHLGAVGGRGHLGASVACNQRALLEGNK